MLFKKIGLILFLIATIGWYPFVILENYTANNPHQTDIDDYLRQNALRNIVHSTSTTPTPAPDATLSNRDEIETVGDWRDASKERRMKHVAQVSHIARKTNYLVIEKRIYDCLEQYSWFFQRQVRIGNQNYICSRDD